MAGLNLTSAFTDDLSGASASLPKGEAEDSPKKPGIPLLLPCAAVLWATSASAYALQQEADQHVSMTIAVASAIALLALAIAAALTRNRMAFVASFLLLGIALGSSSACSYHATQGSLPGGNVQMELRATSDARVLSFGSTMSAECTISGLRPFQVSVMFSEPQGLLAGSVISCDASFEDVSDDYVTRSYMSGEVATVRVSSYESVPVAQPYKSVLDARKHAIELLGEHGGRQAGILQALVCGYRSTIQQDGTYDEFKVCGLAHVVAVSGAHLAIVTMVFGWLLKLLHAGRKMQLAASIAFVCAYLVFAGIPISAIRASVMAVLSLVSGLAKRRNATLNSLSVCVIGFLVLDPISCVSVSLFLSAGSTLGIVMFASLMTSWLDALPAPLKSTVAEPVGLTLSSNIVTLPYSAATFGMVPLLSLPANVIATPLFSIGCVVGLACTVLCFVMPYAAAPLIGAASQAVWPLGTFVEWASSLPFASLDVDMPTLPMLLLTFALVAILWLTWPRIPTRITCAALSLGLAAYVAIAFLRPPVSGDAIIMLDVGQGDAFIVQSEGQTLLIDTGNEESMLRDALATAGVKHIDAVAITHPDADHCESLGSLSTYMDVGSFVCSSSMLDCDCSKCASLISEAEGIVGAGNISSVSPGDMVNVGKFELEVLWPAAFEDEGGNCDSLCLMARLDSDDDGTPDWRALFTGDAEGEQLDELLRDGRLEDIDVLKVGHHGSKVSVTEDALDVLKPEVALISCGEGNSYGHPAANTVSALEGHGAKVVRTDEQGTTIVSFAKDAMSITRASL